jgi:cell wall-associated NlpC family hydrolase
MSVCEDGNKNNIGPLIVFHNCGKKSIFSLSIHLKKANMLKSILSTATILFLMGAHPLHAQTKQGTSNSAKTDVKFLDDISVEVAPTNSSADPGNLKTTPSLFKHAVTRETVPSISIEQADRLQFKYALLLDTEVESVGSLKLLALMDEWMGTRYRLGGSTKEGIDCSALTQTFFTSIYNLSLPRTAREQFAIASKISRTELQEGDLVFFNTTGGVSHVGIYLQNNKFIHASSSGVTISDLFDEYWVKRFVGVGRVDPSSLASGIKP